MKFLDLFAGVGGFRRGMELAGHTCVGFCEWDKFAAMSYTSMHLINGEQRSRLSEISLKQRQKEILKEGYRNGEWYSADVRLIRGDNIPKADCWCFGAPCQDFSIAGKQAGLSGDRSSLIREVFRILKEIPEENRPEWLIYENVKGMLGSNRGGDFGAILLEMGELGYDTEWQLFNTKNFGVPQNRERVYTIGHLRSRGRKQIFPLEGEGGEDSICEERSISNTIVAIPVINPEFINMRSRGRRFKENGDPSFTLTTLCQGVAVNIDESTTVYAVWYEKYNCYIAIRKLTPKECFRLQGWTDDYFEKAQFVNSDSQLYKQAGNGVTVDVVYEIAKQLSV